MTDAIERLLDRPGVRLVLWIGGGLWFGLAGLGLVGALVVLS